MNKKWWLEENHLIRNIARQRNNRNKINLLQKKLFIFDQDGTIYLDFKPLEGVQNLINYLKDHNKEIVFISNNSSIGSKTYKKKLSKILNINIFEKQIYNSIQATIQYLKIIDIKKIYCLGTNEFLDELSDNNIIITDEKPELVVIGFDTTLTYDKLKKACLFIRDGLDYIATHPDKVCPTQNGFIPDTGSIISLIETATNKKPKNILGKPNPELINFLLKKLNLSNKDAIIFGDRLYTDIKMGINCDITTALVLTGESKIEDIDKYKIVPDFIFKNLQEAYELMK